MSKFTIVIMVLLAALCAWSPANAQNSECLALSNELRALTSRGGFVFNKESRYSEFERAAREQRSQISRAQALIRRNDCARSVSATCVKNRANLAAMNANLKNLERQLARMSPGKGNDRRRQAVEARIQSLGCDSGNRIRRQDQGAVNAGVRQETAPRRRTLMEQIFGVRTFREDGTTAEPEYRGDEKVAGQYGTFRTLCVRSCDGYYFPISFSTRRDRFEEDEQACSQMCPASEVSLYFHSMPSQDSEEMVSYRTEEPYAAMPNAFSYRKAVNPECTCGFARPSGLTEIAGGQSYRIETIQPRQPPTPIPAPRPDPGVDPETLANSEGLFDSADIEAMIRRNQAPQIATPGNRNVRIVGPAFFPVQ